VNENFDVVVVGGGAAGCVLAARLSERPDRSVLLLEAGPDYPNPGQRPDDLIRAASVSDPTLSWSYEGIINGTQPDPVPIIRGRVIGGSGAINGVSFDRGMPGDYDAWGSENWSWSKVLATFRQIESDHDFPDEYHGTAGPIPVRRHDREDWKPLDLAFYDAALALGFREQPDMNHPDRAGVGPRPRNIDSSLRRVDTAVGYLDPARARANLTTWGGTVVRKVLWDGTRVAGVEVVRDDQVQRIEAAEVILAAGAISSPHILFLSGIGQADELRAVGLRVIADVPGVGAEIRDRPIVMYTFEPTVAAVAHGAAYVPTLVAYTAEGSNIPGDMNLSLGSTASSHPGMAGVSAYLVVQLGRSESRGRLRFRTEEPWKAPRIEFNYYEDAFDLQRAREGLRLAKALLRMKELDVFVERLLVGPTDKELLSDDSLDDWIRQTCATGYTSCCTCRMGPASDPLAVVDDHCRVRGVEGLRVADLSISPTMPCANGFATAVMIGERAAALVDRDL
jgi:choline dehydrogenase